jgi:hypothetical protein
MRISEQYHDEYPFTLADARAEARELAGDLMADILPWTDSMVDAKFAPDFDDLFAPEDGNTDDILIATEQIGRPIGNDCKGCGTELPDGLWVGGGYEVCDQCYYDQEPPCCTICDAIGHGYPGGGPCPLEDRGYDTDGIWR